MFSTTTHHAARRSFLGQRPTAALLARMESDWMAPDGGPLPFSLDYTPPADPGCAHCGRPVLGGGAAHASCAELTADCKAALAAGDVGRLATLAPRWRERVGVPGVAPLHYALHHALTRLHIARSIVDWERFEVESKAAEPGSDLHYAAVDRLLVAGRRVRLSDHRVTTAQAAMGTALRGLVGATTPHVPSVPATHEA